MKITRIYYASSFKKALRRLPPSDREKAKRKIVLFMRDPFDPSLKTHKLKGKLAVYWSFSISYHLRILFEFTDTTSVGFIDMGSHRIYK